MGDLDRPQDAAAIEEATSTNRELPMPTATTCKSRLGAAAWLALASARWKHQRGIPYK